MADEPAPEEKKPRGRGRPTKVKENYLSIQLQVRTGTKEEQLKSLYDDWYGCNRCMLGDFRCDAMGHSSKEICFADGSPDAHVMIIGEAPGEEEEATSIPFIGQSGKLLNQMLAQVSDDTGIRDLAHWYKKATRTKDNVNYFHEKVLEWRRKEFFITNVVACRPEDNRTPTPVEVRACWNRLANLIYIVDPLVIITCGKTAIETLLHKNVEITRDRGKLFDITIPGRVGKVTYPAMAALHPSALLRKADWGVKGGDYDKTRGDILAAMKIVDGLRRRYFGTGIPVRMEKE